MDGLMVLLRILHIVSGVFWVGTLFFMEIILEPRLRALGPTMQNPVMGALMPVLMPVNIVNATITILSGVAMTLIMRGSALGTFLATGWGWAILLGFVTTIAAAVVGFGFVVPAGLRLGKLGQSIQGRPPSPDEAQQMGQLSARIRTLTRIIFVLLIIAVGTMAAARFV